MERVAAQISRALVVLALAAPLVAQGKPRTVHPCAVPEWMLGVGYTLSEGPLIESETIYRDGRQYLRCTYEVPVLDGQFRETGKCEHIVFEIGVKFGSAERCSVTYDNVMKYGR